MNKTLMLLLMIFCHIVDDYYLQGWLSSAKQKKWWNKNAPDSLYKCDYIMALLMHSFSWTFSVSVFPILYAVILGEKWYPILFILNLILHMFVDNLKANEKRINLIQDQIIHLFQIFFIWIWYMF